MISAPSQVECAYDQVVEWFEHFHEVEDPRQSGKVAYPLEKMLLQCLLAVPAGADSWVEIAEFGKKMLDFLRRFLAFEYGTALHDQFGNCLQPSMPKPFKIASSPGLPRSRSSAPILSPSTVRRSFQQGGGKAPIHMLSARSSRQRLVLGQRKVSDKSKEITAIPELLDLLTVNSSIVTIDATVSACRLR